jgi:hypothetical protein
VRAGCCFVRQLILHKLPGEQDLRNALELLVPFTQGAMLLLKLAVLFGGDQ